MKAGPSRPPAPRVQYATTRSGDGSDANRNGNVLKIHKNRKRKKSRNSSMPSNVSSLVSHEPVSGDVHINGASANESNKSLKMTRSCQLCQVHLKSVIRCA